jgi:nitrile hydratase accessory protein
MDNRLDHRITHMEGDMTLPRRNGELVFASPWEARAFGMAVALNDSGAYEWRDFSQGLAAETATVEQHGRPSSYYERWLAALEKLAVAKGLVTPAEIEARAAQYASGAYDDHDHLDDHEHHHEHGSLS